MKSSPKPGLTLAIAFGAAVSALAPARAADLPSHKTPAAPVIESPAVDWTGFYLGGFGGGSFAQASQGYSVTSSFLSANLPTLIPYVNGVGSQRLNARGADVGVEAGYNWKVANGFYLGLAADLRGSDLGGDRATSGTLPIVQIPFVITQKLSGGWRGSLRLRAGIAPVDNLLIYVTGGPALGRFTYSASYLDTLVPPFAPGNETEYASFRALRAGWTLGTGAEWALNRNWSLKGEYAFTDYAAFGGTGVLPLQQPPSTAYIGHSSGAIRENSLRVGVNFHFN